MSLKILVLSLILSTHVIIGTIAANETQKSDGNEYIDWDLDSDESSTRETPYPLNFSGRTPPEWSPTPNTTTTELYDIDPGFNAPDLSGVTYDPSWLKDMPSLPPLPWEKGSESKSNESRAMDGFSVFLILFIVFAFIGITIFVAFIIVDIHRRYRQNTEDRERYIIEKHRQLDRVGNPKTPKTDELSKSKSETQRS